MLKVVFYVLAIITYCPFAMSQFNFDSIKICHAANKELKQIIVKEYIVTLQKGQLSSFYSQDGIVKYDENNRMLSLKGWIMNKPDSLSIQLTPNGVRFSTASKTTTIHTITSTAIDTSTVVNMGSFSFSVLFSRGYFERTWLSFGNKFVIIRIHKDSQGYNWDISTETNTNENVLLFAQSLGKPHFLVLHDDLNKVGIRLFSEKQNGVFNVLQGLKKVTEDKYGSDTDYKLRYKNGILRKSKWQPACSN